MDQIEEAGIRDSPQWHRLPGGWVYGTYADAVRIEQGVAATMEHVDALEEQWSAERLRGWELPLVRRDE